MSGIKRIISYLRDQSIDIRIRMMYFLEYASLIACVIGTVFMLLLHQSVESMIPNIILFVMSFIGLYLAHVKKQYDLSTLVMIIGCANIAVPWMFFVAGGNQSGMHVWLIFSVVVTCMMSRGGIRILMATITIIEDLACICIGHFYPNLITPLVGENAVITDQVQSFAAVCVCLTAMLAIYINTYENQRQQLEKQSIELRNIMQTDALTGVFNRRAYYDEINTYADSKQANDLVIVAMDVNGLKKVNDLLGHAAGDDYIRSAAKAIKDAIGQYGHIFRTGGDEFMALLHCSTDDAKNIETRINNSIANLENSWTEKMTIAVGVVCCNEMPDVALAEIEKAADKRMYENKAAFYRNSGIDRRR